MILRKEITGNWGGLRIKKKYKKLVIGSQFLVHCFLKWNMKEAGGGGREERFNAWVKLEPDIPLLCLKTCREKPLEQKDRQKFYAKSRCFSRINGLQSIKELSLRSSVERYTELLLGKVIYSNLEE